MKQTQWAWFAAWMIAGAILTMPSDHGANLVGVLIGLYLLRRFWSQPEPKGRVPKDGK